MASTLACHMLTRTTGLGRLVLGGLEGRCLLLLLLLLVPQGLYRVQAPCSASRVYPKEEADGEREAERN